MERKLRRTGPRAARAGGSIAARVAALVAVVAVLSGCAAIRAFRYAPGIDELATALANVTLGREPGCHDDNFFASAADAQRRFVERYLSLRTGAIDMVSSSGKPPLSFGRNDPLAFARRLEMVLSCK